MAPFVEAGIDPARLTLYGGSTWREHVELFNTIDISLDTYPHSGGVTTLESLMMGVPVVALCDKTYSGRGSATILTTLDMTDWIARSEAQYIDIALRKAADVQALLDLKQQLRPRFKHSWLGDANRYVRLVEGEFRDLWQAWCARQGGHSGRG